MATFVFLKDQAGDLSLEHFSNVFIDFSLVPDEQRDAREVLLLRVVLVVLITPEGLSDNEVSLLKLRLIMLGLLKEVHGLFQQSRGTKEVDSDLWN